MKLLAIINRGYKRDFIDVAAMLRHGLSLVQVIGWATADISGLTVESLQRSLAWHGVAMPRSSQIQTVSTPQLGLWLSARLMLPSRQL